MTRAPSSAAAPRVPFAPLVLVCTRSLSSFGSAMTAFALDVWILRRTGSYATFALLAMLTYLPNLVVAPFAGVLVDRLDKRAVLAACEFACAAVLLAALACFLRGTLDARVAAGLVFTLASVSQVRWIAMSVALSLLAPKPARAALNGLQQAFQGATDLAGPLAGAAALAGLGFGGVLGLDVASCAIGLLGLVALRGRTLVTAVPALASSPSAASAGAATRSAWREALAGFGWIRAHREMLVLLLFIMGYNLAGSVYGVTLAPYLLGTLPPHGLGVALGLDGAGALAAGAALARWGHRVAARTLVFGAAAAFGALLVAWGLVRGAPALWSLAFVAGLLVSTIVASLQTVWQDAVPVELQGRVFAARRMVSFLLVPLAILASVPISQLLAAPCLAASPLARHLWGAGPTGAFGLMLSVLGLGLAVASIAAWPRPAAGAVAPSEAAPDADVPTAA